MTRAELEALRANAARAQVGVDTEVQTPIMEVDARVVAAMARLCAAEFAYRDADNQRIADRSILLRDIDEALAALRDVP